jgi:hypothetical protein
MTCLHRGLSHLTAARPSWGWLEGPRHVNASRVSYPEVTTNLIVKAAPSVFVAASRHRRSRNRSAVALQVGGLALEMIRCRPTTDLAD